MKISKVKLHISQHVFSEFKDIFKDQLTMFHFKHKNHDIQLKFLFQNLNKLYLRAYNLHQ